MSLMAIYLFVIAKSQKLIDFVVFSCYSCYQVNRSWHSATMPRYGAIKRKSMSALSRMWNLLFSVVQAAQKISHCGTLLTK